MPAVRSLTSKHYARVIETIVLFSEIRSSCSWYIKKKLLYIVITRALLGYLCNTPTV